MVEVIEFMKALSIGVLLVSLVFWIFFMFYYISKKFVDKVIPFLKYAVFRRKFKEKDVAWCMDAVEKEFNEDMILKILLLQGYPKSKISDMVYIFKKCKNKMKGGIKNE